MITDKVDKIVDSDAYLYGKLRALSCLANSIRLDCKRNGFNFEASIIKAMQDGLRQCWLDKTKE